MTKLFIRIFAFLLFFCSSLSCAKQTEQDQKSNLPIFISLGSHCEPSQQLILNNLRSAAFPFDWLLTLNFPGFISLLQDDFRFLMDKRYLTQDASGVILNTRYQIDFRHELHDWTDYDFFKHHQEINEKYQRRINRFKQCNYNKGRAYFIRAAFDVNLNPHLPTITADCTKVTRKQAEILKDILSKKFPKLDFYLVIVNYAEENAKDIKDLEKVLEFKIRKSHRKEDYTNMFKQLLEHACQNH